MIPPKLYVSYVEKRITLQHKKDEEIKI
jgi:hypothetical protein